MMTTPHKHAALIKAWADGAEIEVFEVSINSWRVVKTPIWAVHKEYRVAPALDIVRFSSILLYGNPTITHEQWTATNVKLIFDGDTYRLKSIEMLK